MIGRMFFADYKPKQKTFEYWRRFYDDAINDGYTGDTAAIVASFRLDARGGYTPVEFGQSVKHTSRILTGLNGALLQNASRRFCAHWGLPIPAEIPIPANTPLSNCRIYRNWKLANLEACYDAGAEGIKVLGRCELRGRDLTRALCAAAARKFNVNCSMELLPLAAEWCTIYQNCDQ